MRLTTPTRPDDGAGLGPRRRLSPVWTCVAVVVLLLAVFVADRATDSAPVQHLYYLPIILAGLRFGLPGAVAAALASIVSYHVANPQLLAFHYGESDVVQILLFLAVGIVTAVLARDASRLRQIASTDDLTGLHNLRSFEVRLAEMVRVSCHARGALALLVLDVDRLKPLNDVHGHLTGAEAVRTVGHIIAASVPGEAVACRYGGDEFVVGIPLCSTARAGEVADGIRRAVNAATPVLAGRGFPAGTLSVSIGVARHSFDDASAGAGGDVGEALFRAADAALYRAKASGRNHVCVA